MDITMDTCEFRARKRRRLSRVANQMRDCVFTPSSTTKSAYIISPGIWYVDSTTSGWKHRVIEFDECGRKIFACTCNTYKQYEDNELHKLDHNKLQKNCKHINGVVIRIFLDYLEQQGTTEEKTHELADLFSKMTM